jgi:hypothetical protein
LLMHVYTTPIDDSSREDAPYTGHTAPTKEKAWRLLTWPHHNSLPIIHRSDEWRHRLAFDIGKINGQPV